MVIKGAHLLLIRRCEHVVLRAAQAQQHGLDTVLGAARDDAVEVDPKRAVVSTGMQGRSYQWQSAYLWKSIPKTRASSEVRAIVSIASAIRNVSVARRPK